eukprot:1994715-Pleurochrysis_carterae.AAC.1
MSGRARARMRVHARVRVRVRTRSRARVRVRACACACARLPLLSCVERSKRPTRAVVSEPLGPSRSVWAKRQARKLKTVYARAHARS